MKVVSDDLKKALAQNAISPLRIKIEIFVKWPQGEIISRFLTGYNNLAVTLEGCAEDWINPNDKCIVTCYPKLNEVTVNTVVYGTNQTGIIFVETSDNTDFLSNSPAYLYKKVDISSKDISYDDLKGINKNLDIFSVNDWDSGAFDFALINRDNIYWDDKKRSGIFFNGTIETTVASESTGELVLNSSGDTLLDNSLKGHKLFVLDGAGKGEEYNILSNEGWTLQVYPLTTTNIDSGDKIRIIITNEFIVKANISLLDYPEDKVNIFSGIINPEDISFDPVKNIIELSAKGFLNEIQKHKGYNVVNTDTQDLQILTGVQLISYQPKTAGSVSKDIIGTKKISLKIKNSKIGFNPREFRPHATPYIREALYYKPPYYFRTERSGWEEHCKSDAEERYNPEDSNKVGIDTYYGDFIKSDFSFNSEVGYLICKGQTIDTNSIEISDLYLKLDEGDPQKIISSPPNIIRDKSFTEGTYYGEDIEHIESEAPIYEFYKIFDNAVPPVAFYMGFMRRVKSIFFIGVSNYYEENLNITWYYSKDGSGASGWQELTVTDETNGLTQDGKITFDIPNDWSPKAGIGTEIETPFYYIRGVITSATNNPQVTITHIKSTMILISDRGDQVEVFCLPEHLPLNETSETFSLSKYYTPDVNSPSSKFGLVWRGSRLYDIVNRLINSTTIFRDNIINESDYLIPGETPSIYNMGKCPPGLNIPLPIPFRLCTIGDNVYVARYNKIWRFGEISNFELVGSVPPGYEITEMAKAPEYNFIYGLVVDLKAMYNFENNTIYATHGIFGIKEIGENVTFYAPTPNSEIFIPDTRFLDHSGLLVITNPGSDFDYYFSIGKIVVPYLTDVNKLNCENILNLGLHSFTSNMEQTVEYQYGLQLSLNQEIGLSDIRPPIAISRKMYCAGYNKYSTTIGLPNDVQWRCARFKHSYHQRGFFVPAICNLTPLQYGFFITKRNDWLGGTTETRDIALFEYSPTNKNTVEPAPFGTYNEKLQHFTGDFTWPAPMDNRQRILGYPMHGILGSRSNENRDLFIALEHDKLMFFSEEPPTDDSIMQLGWIELATQYIIESSGYELLGQKPYKIIWYDSSAATYTDVTDFANLVLEQGDKIYFLGAYRFSNILLQCDSLLSDPHAALDFKISNGQGEFASVNKMLIGGWSRVTWPDIHLFRYDMSPIWRPQTLETFGSHWILEMTYNNSSSWSIIPKYIKATLWQIWGSEQDTIATEKKFLTPMELAYDDDNDYLYSVLLDRKTVTFKLGAIDVGSIRGVLLSGDSNYDKMVLASSYPTEWDTNMFASNLLYSQIYNKLFFTLTDPIEKSRSAMLFSAVFNGSTLSIQFESIIKPGFWNCSNLVETSNAIYGVVYTDDDYSLFEYSTNHYLRIEEADFIDQNVREAISDILTPYMLCCRVTEDRNIIIEPKYPSTLPTPAVWKSGEQLLDIEESYLDSNFYDKVSVKYDSLKVEKGTPLQTDRIFEFSSSYIKSSGVADALAEELFKQLSSKRRYMTVLIPPLFYHELRDVVKLDIPSRFANIDLNKKYIIIGLDITFQECKATLLEVF